MAIEQHTLIKHFSSLVIEFKLKGRGFIPWPHLSKIFQPYSDHDFDPAFSQ